jgi:hypothetical protein
MKRAILLAVVLIALAVMPLTALADDVSIDANGNVTTGTSNSNANFEVTGGSGEDAIVGIASGTGASGVYGVNTDSNNVGLLGNDDYGVYGNSASGVAIYGMSPSGWAGYFYGNVNINGNLSLTGSLTGYSETDPQVGTLTNGKWCTSDGSVVNCTTNAPVTSETDPQVGTLTNGKWCTSDGSAVNCATNAPVTSETDPQVGSNTTNYVPKWNGSALVSGTIFDNGNVGIGTTSPAYTLDMAGHARVQGPDGFNSAGETAIIYYGDGNHYVKGTYAGGLNLNSANTASDPITFSFSGSEKVRITNTGNVGIGTSSPNEQLEITGNLRLPATTATTGIIRAGVNTLIHTYGTNNFFAGVNAGNLTMTGADNSAIGIAALQSNTTGDENTGSGAFALHYNTTGNYNTADGAFTLYHNTTAWWNTASGFNALWQNISGNANTAYGVAALGSNTSGYENTASGMSALVSNTTASRNTAVGLGALYTQSYDNSGIPWSSYNTAVGYQALYKNQPTSINDGLSNTAIGSEALYENTTGNFNTASGYMALYSNTTGYSNAANGHYALGSNTTGSFNTANGTYALYSNTTGIANTAIGRFALYSNTTGNYNTAIGFQADVSGGALTNATAIGYDAQVNASNKVVIGNTYVASIGGYAAWSNFSDKRVKTDIQDLDKGLDLIRQLRPVSFKMKNGNGYTDFGFIAQDIEALLGDRYNVLDVGGGEERMLSLRYTQFIAPMVKAMQEQQEIIDSQQARLESQQEQINELKEIVEELRRGM